MKRWEEQGWQQEDLDKLELSFLKKIFECTDTEGVDGTIAYARYLNKIGVNPDNYPIFLKLIKMKNHWVVDALIGKKNSEKFFQNVQPNYYIIRECFNAFTQSRPRGIFHKSLLLFLGLLKVTYEVPLEGYRVYPVTPTDVNNIGKHLDETEKQTYPLNQSILFILDRIAALVDPGRPEENEDIIAVATQANNIRGKFLDMTKSLKEAIPENLLKAGNLKEEEIPPSNTL